MSDEEPINGLYDESHLDDCSQCRADLIEEAKEPAIEVRNLRKQIETWSTLHAEAMAQIELLSRKALALDYWLYQFLDSQRCGLINIDDMGGRWKYQELCAKFGRQNQ